MTTHWDHSTSSYVKGVNLLSCLYYNEGMSVLLGFDVIQNENLVFSLAEGAAVGVGGVAFDIVSRSDWGTAKQKALKNKFAQAKNNFPETASILAQYRIMPTNFSRFF